MAALNSFAHEGNEVRVEERRNNWLHTVATPVSNAMNLAATEGLC